MNFKAEKTDKTNEMKLEFTIDAKIFEDGIQEVFKKSAKYFNVPGFRKGKAPYNIVERAYGKEIFYEDAFNEVVPKIYDEEIKKNNIEAVSQPQIDIVQMEKGKDLIFTAIVQVKPEVKLGKYEGIEIEKIAYPVTDEDVKKEIEKVAEKNARLVTVEDRPVKNGDITVIDFAGSVDGVPFDGGTAEDYELEIGSYSFIEGFEDQMVGMKIDEEKDINVTFPEDYFSKELAGKPAVFKVTVHEIKEKQIPAIDDELAKDASEFDTLKEWEASIKKNMQEQNDHKAKHEMEDAVIKKIVENAEFEVPSGMIDSEIDMRIRSFENNLYYQGLTLEKYLELVHQSMSDLRNNLKESAEEAVRTQLVLEAVSKELGDKVKPDDEKIKANIKEMAEKYNKTEEELNNNEEYMEHLKKNHTIEKTVEYIMDKAKIK